MYKVHIYGYASEAVRNCDWIVFFRDQQRTFANLGNKQGPQVLRSTARTPTFVATCITAHFIYDIARLANRLKNKAL